IRYRQGQKKVDQSFVTEFDFDLKTAQARQFFVQDALANDLLFCFKIFLSRTGRPDTEHISKELGYVSVYAIHKAKVLEEELWSVVGVGDVIDISDEILLRYGVSAEQILAQHAKRRQFVASIEASD
ncbi:MAG: PilZ domain-containing protein, partial [Gammaproteobacteria bacterium]|nr:PilZ domain-containing protein [Gammaproteobacteria bacterium]